MRLTDLCSDKERYLKALHKRVSRQTVEGNSSCQNLCQENPVDKKIRKIRVKAKAYTITFIYFVYIILILRLDLYLDTYYADEQNMHGSMILHLML